MVWIKLQLKPDSLKLLSISRLTQKSAQICYFSALKWLFFVDENCQNCAPKIGKKEFKKITGWRNDSLLHAFASEEVGWLKYDAQCDEIEILDFDVHFSVSAKRRAVEQKRKARQRDKSGTLGPDCTGTKNGLDKIREDKKQIKTYTPTSPSAAHDGNSLKPKLARKKPPTQPASETMTGATKPRQPDLVWDAVCEVFNLTADTKRDKTRIGGIVRDLKRKLNGLAPMPSIRRAEAAYRKIMPPGTIFTPEAMLKHWGACMADGES